MTDRYIRWLEDKDIAPILRGYHLESLTPSQQSLLEQAVDQQNRRALNNKPYASRLAADLNQNTRFIVDGVNAVSDVIRGFDHVSGGATAPDYTHWRGCEDQSTKQK
ncbi:MAG: hypothetical protein UX91_C0005G0016 [Candidatus Amesbacteria bacterium GW2011_GWB1_47_19]|nr:MAG: hypothetical protein UW51_C0007G0016 [Candidatus Amesbacteria bacterium GW2011_GWA1_44_24]KKU31098.1 MAG: hypothetical protein UX46_C0007G0016 [Candidatus Amesbacteria bacterium GW2011_GWC1_46_24]KKU67219.1 MAG: hypothetical protein UX91_C0005G0016 [Candidatus Amesbacteria bacterium GW2011_GWB1_47_19]OGD05778.1 MAG: hypothetical protein A2379_01480 [Candidatus Amesbacteria bacterium RIFOXYB1_FULL_47_13]HBC72635.1 hypothetical protein [Candidatus Amesbacteria bacterium]